MTSFVRTCIAAAAIALAGCTTNPPLLFGDTTTFGLRIGNDTATSGGAVSLGYKEQSVAIVPVSILNGQGRVRLLHGRDDTKAKDQDQRSDAMSVFASFESKRVKDSSASTTSGTTPGSSASTTSGATPGPSAPAPSGTTPGSPTTPVIELGQVFSTGLAAQRIALGFSCQKQSGGRCEPTAAQAALDAADAAQAAAGKADSAAGAASAAAGAASAAAADLRLAIASGQPVMVAQTAEAAPSQATASSDRPYQSPLVFMRTDVVGFDIGGSLAQQGLQFVLGAGFRNVAAIPVAAQGAGGEVVRISGKGAEGDGEQLDTLSVIGQFKSSTATQGLDFGLERYFATGIAARSLGDGLASAIEVASAKAAAAAKAEPQAGSGASAATVSATAPASSPSATLASN
jgi:hypothetical protein